MPKKETASSGSTTSSRSSSKPYGSRISQLSNPNLNPKRKTVKDQGTRNKAQELRSKPATWRKSKNQKAKSKRRYQEHATRNKTSNQQHACNYTTGNTENDRECTTVIHYSSTYAKSGLPTGIGGRRSRPHLSRRVKHLRERRDNNSRLDLLVLLCQPVPH